MTDWTLEGYRSLVEAALEGGYRTVGFEVEPSAGILYLRHDVDLSLDAALRMARLEAELGVSGDVLPHDGIRVLQPRLERGRGGDRGASLARTSTRPPRGLPERKAGRSVRAGHCLAQPRTPSTCAPLSTGALNVMEPSRFDPATYRSDSNQHWRSGDPRDELSAGAFPWLQLLIHPEIWAYPGERMGETMRAMLEGEKERRLEQLAADRIDLS